MTEHDIPKGVSLDTLLDVLEGWGAVGAAVETIQTRDGDAERTVSERETTRILQIT